MMQSPTVKGRMDLVEEELVNIDVRFKDVNENIQKIFMLLQNLQTTIVSTPSVEDKKTTALNTEMKSFLNDEIEYKPSRRDRESIASFFTTEPLTPAMENVRQKQKDNNENNKPDFINEYEKSKTTNENFNANNL
jgi:hypothetical protein